ncbi:putative glutaredoxin-1 [Apostichopus japonicus]|uniref:Putative glutaredoxin-1 n=1 Tax=Stichopus japonicus TaxID=307972 RepID=A0A2G8JV69_STIJA|nr:putative glutaredoxin-1 [Apostichopus japonicus]
MVKQFVDAQIKNNKVVVFSKSYCPYCTMAKSALSDAGLKEYTLIEIENRDDSPISRIIFSRLLEEDQCLEFSSMGSLSVADPS